MDFTREELEMIAESLAKSERDLAGMCEDLNVRARIEVMKYVHKIGDLKCKVRGYVDEVDFE